MLYLEDYLEMIENLPMEMRDRFTEMREMDLQVQNAMDSLDDKVKVFFKKSSVQGAVKQEWKDEQFNKIKEDYNKALEDADEKVQLANQIYEMVERYLRKLDQELSKFKMELEADNAGITEVLERRSLEMDAPPPTMNNHRAEKRKYCPSMSSNHLDKRITSEKVLSSLANEVARETIGPQRGGITVSSPAGAASSTAATNQNPINLMGSVGSTGSAAIAAAASRAIGATLEMQLGRRTSSLKASYEAYSRTPDLSKDFSFGSEGYRGSSGASSQPATPPEPKAPRNKKTSSRASQQQQLQAAAPPATPTPVEPALPEVVPAVAADETTAATSWTYDPNEPRYCICNDVSYGEMVGCDNNDCPIEWFHYGCVGLTQAPKGKWYCPQCMVAMKRRGRK